MRFLIFILFIFKFVLWLHAEEPQVTLKKIQQMKTVIENTAKVFEIDPLVLSSIIYTERTLNFNWDDEVFDEYLAQLGYNSSIGFCQIKIKTAFFVENQYFNLDHMRSLYGKYIIRSQTKKELIEKLNSDSVNVVYAAAYIRLIQNFWKLHGFPIHNKPEIIGTLYSIGLYNSNGTIRKPHFAPSANEFGLKVSEAFSSYYSKEII